jgi:hypothetical protein
MEIIDLGNGESGIFIASNLLLIMSLSLGIILSLYWYWTTSKRCDKLLAIVKNRTKAMDSLNADLVEKEENVKQYKSLYNESNDRYKKEKEKNQALLRDGVTWEKG